MDSNTISSMMAGMLNNGPTAAAMLLVTVLLFAGAVFVWSKL